MKNRILAYIVIIATVFQMFSGISHDFKSMNVMADENELSQPKMVDGTYQISSAKELMWAKENPGKDYILTSDIDLSGYENFQEMCIRDRHGTAYIPYLMAVALYIGIANLIGLLGFKPPTKDMNVTVALAVMSLSLIHI